MQEVQTHYHGKVRLQRNGHELEINVFKDTLNEVFLDVQQVIAQFSGDPHYMSQAQLEIKRAQMLASAPKKPANAKPTAGAVNTPVCADCGTDEAVELITFTDRDTGEQKRRFKCQACGKWLGKAF